MSPKITAEHVQRGALVYVRQSTMMQVVEHTESQRRQYALADLARQMGFATVEVIDDDLGRSGSGLVARPGFQRLVAAVCTGAIGAVVCLEASRLARNGRDWHHLIDLCALVGALVIDHESVYDPRLMNDRLLLGLKGTMSEYELSLLRQRGLAARDSKAKRGELRVGLPPGYCWDEIGRVEIDPDGRVSEAIRLVFRKFAELGSVRQVLLWMRAEGLQLPTVRRWARGTVLEWQLPAYHNVLSILTNPQYAGAYAFGKTETRMRIVEGRALKTGGHPKPMDRWSVLLRNHHAGYISWDDYQRNQAMIAENAHMKKRASRKSARGGRALLTGLLRCGRCGHMLHVFYGMRSGHAHRYQCRGSATRTPAGHCVGIGGVRVDRAVSVELMTAVAPQAVTAALEAADRADRARAEVRAVLAREVDDAKYEARLAERRYEAVDPDKRLVARELEGRWEAALERVRALEERLTKADAGSPQPAVADRGALLALAADLPAVWNAPSSDMRTKQRIVHLMIREIVVDLDDATNEAVLVIHWAGGRHTEVRVARVRTGRYPADRRPNAVEVIRQLGGQWPDRELAVTMNRMRCPKEQGASWTEARVRALRERLGVPSFDPTARCEKTISADEAAARLGVSIGSLMKLIRAGLLPAKQLMPSAPWQVPEASLDTEPVRSGVQAIASRRPRKSSAPSDTTTLRLPGI